MNTERLLDAARRLRLVPAEKFNLDYFTRADCKVVRRPEDLNACGSAACLLGWMPTWYPEHWVYDWGLPVLIRGNFTHSPFAHGANWFGISYFQMQLLADAGHYPEYNFKPTPEQVAKRIEDTVAGWGSDRDRDNEQRTIA